MLLLFVEIPVRRERVAQRSPGKLLKVNLPTTAGLLLIIQLLDVAASAGRRAGYPGFSEYSSH